MMGIQRTQCQRGLSVAAFSIFIQVATYLFSLCCTHLLEFSPVAFSRIFFTMVVSCSTNMKLCKLAKHTDSGASFSSFNTMLRFGFKADLPLTLNVAPGHFFCCSHLSRFTKTLKKSLKLKCLFSK